MFSIRGKVSIVYLVIFLIPFLANAQSIDSVNLIDHLTIGNDPSKSIEYILGEPRDVSVDSKGNIYVADQKKMTVKVFDKSGNYLRSIGQRGRGPGEFLSFKELTINSKDELLIADREQLRVTKLDHRGEVLNTFAVNNERRDVGYFSKLNRYQMDKIWSCIRLRIQAVIMTEYFTFGIPNLLNFHKSLAHSVT